MMTQEMILIIKNKFYEMRGQAIIDSFNDNDFHNVKKAWMIQQLLFMMEKFILIMIGNLSEKNNLFYERTLQFLNKWKGENLSGGKNGKIFKLIQFSLSPFYFSVNPRVLSIIHNK